MSTAAYSLVWTQWDTSNMSNAILPHILAVFAVGSTLVYCYDLGPIYVWHQEVLRKGRMKRNEVRQLASHVVVYIPCSKKKNMVYSYAMFSGFYCSMETSRRMLDGTRNYVTRVAAALSREHVPVYTYNTQSDTARKWHGFSVGIKIDFIVV